MTISWIEILRKLFRSILRLGAGLFSRSGSSSGIYSVN